MRIPMRLSTIVAALFFVLANTGVGLRADDKKDDKKDYGELKVTSFPSGANVSVDGTKVNDTTPVRLELRTGKHTVVVFVPSSGWAADTRTVDIDNGKNDLSVTLLPLFATHMLVPSKAIP